MKIKIIFTLCFSALLLCAIPVINLLVDSPVVMPLETWSGKAVSFQKVAPIIQQACLSCHSSKAQLPWYAGLPGVKQLIQNNREEGLEELNMESALFSIGNAPNKKVLARIKKEIELGKMPPWDYRAAHWGAILSGKQKQAIYDWIRDEQQTQNI